MGSKACFIVGAKRTPFGTFGGKLKGHTATDLGVVSSKAALTQAGLKPENIDSVIFGNVGQSASDAIYLARHIGLKIGCPVHVPALVVNRLCGSGFQSIINGAQEIGAGDAEIVLTGGSENMTQFPFALRGSRFGMPFGQQQVLEDTLWSGLTDSYVGFPMAITAENLAEKYKISRAESDAFAIRSQQNWKKAHDNGVFSMELAPITIKTKKGEVNFDTDEHPKVDSTVDIIGKLRPVFKKDGVVTAANASGICDGSSTVIIASEDAVKKHNLTPLARLVSYFAVGCDPSIMGIGPVPAIQGALSRAKLTLDQMDLIEVNEAFAPQTLAVIKELGLNMDITNLNGGGIALGHPLAASGSRITAHLTHELRRTNKKYAIGSACIGGGQGIALVLERC